MMEIFTPRRSSVPVRAAVFDWDGTISTLREGWEAVMQPLMMEMINPTRVNDPVLEEEIARYIDESTGIQTIFQMQWLCARVEKEGAREVLDAWEYKRIYNERLMQVVNSRIQKLSSGQLRPEDYMIKGSADFLKALADRGVRIFIASGTDNADVVRETKCLGLYPYFSGVLGAPEGKAECSKEKVIRELLGSRTLPAEGLIVVGDGKVEIRLGKEHGAYSIGVASDEKRLCGFNPVKRERLISAGADSIVGDFLCGAEIMEQLFFSNRI